MKFTKLALGAITATAMLMPITASAQIYQKQYEKQPATQVAGKVAKSCSINGGSLCPPGKPVEKIVPEYYDVPSKVKHIYYDKPPVRPVTSKIIHHVPVPVYGRQVVQETVQGGRWTGPMPGCCGTQYRPPVITHVPPPVPHCRQGKPTRYGTSCR